MMERVERLHFFPDRFVVVGCCCCSGFYFFLVVFFLHQTFGERDGLALSELWQKEHRRNQGLHKMFHGPRDGNKFDCGEEKENV